MSETWLINASPAVASTAVNATVDFISNGELYDTFEVPTSKGSMGNPGTITYFSNVRGSGYPVYYWFPAGWKNDNYRTVTFISPITDANLKTWLSANGTKTGSNDYKRYYKNPVLLGTSSYKYRPYTVLTPTVALSLNLTGCSTTQTTMNRLGQTVITFTRQTGYNWPTSVQVTGATAVSWDPSLGKLVVEKPTLNTVTIKVTCAKITYSITENLTNVAKSGTHPTSIEYGGSATLIYTAADNYELPDNITVTGAEYSWKESTGTLTLTNPTGAVTITMAGVSLLKIITAGTYVVKDAPTVTSTHAQFAFTTNTVAGSAITVTSAGITYALAAPTGSTQVYTAATSAWTLPAYKTLVLAADVHVSEAFNTWWTANVLPKLDTPTGLSITGNTLSFNAVTNAEQYEVFAGSTSLGTYSPVTLINFTIDGESYQAESGMTWAQWVASSYNTGGYYVNLYGNIAVGEGGGGGANVTTDSAYNNAVTSADVITATTYYYGMPN